MKRISCKDALRGPHWVGLTRVDAPLPSGYLPGDLVGEDGTIQRTPHPIVGILDLMNRTRYGFSSRGIPQYLFYPLDTGYPPMIVGSKAPTTANQWGVVRFDSWKSTSKWPHGALQEVLGPVGNSETDRLALRLHIHPTYRRTKHESVPLPSENYDSVESWDVCFNIDPPGCKDVDDVVSWRQTGLQTWEFGIHIANVAHWVPAGSELDFEARQRGTTVYEDGVLRPMLPSVISEEAGSLLADGKPRPVVSAVWQISEAGIQGPTWRSSWIRVQHSYTYESILNDSEKAKQLQNFLERVWGSDVSEDPHRWIEVAMIAYNRAAAHLLKKVGAGILRRHAGTLPSGNTLKTLAEETGCAELAWLGQAAGEYCLVSDSETTHVGLGEDLYCHASSPLRRYADLVNQRILLASMHSGDSNILPTDSELPFHLNQIGRAVKQWERSMWCLDHLKTNEISEAEGWILGFKQKDSDVQVLIYVPFWKRTVRVGFFSEGEMEEGWCLKPRDGSCCWIAKSGQLVQVRAFCDVRNPRWSERFVFSCMPEKV